ncbi:type I restriction endonuclease subunit S [Alcanivorax sp. 97CO-5]|uniref:restriction endonuclease subunit S n=1 Tax=unclassified Alcanivorax TaxID=2638842 RepID=UPI0003E7EE38|nr:MULTISPECIES: restriction endonuclease subunit S [unclassified Alcanivorax]EUC68773.1 type I restriction endonuclease subunit S [Alcanivorax sp. 97CO-5]PKG00836.1 restriction endonuclease subunit S [Alcanivorax sp. 97CO-6]
MASNPSTHLGELFKSSRKKGEAGLPLLSVTLNNGLIVRDQLDRRTETNLEASEHLLVQSGDIAYNMMRVWQGALGRASVNGLVSPAYVVLRPTAKIDSLYAEYLFKTPRMIYLFWAYSYGLTKDRLRLYFNDFARIPVTIPNIKEQRKIAQILSTWDKAITTTEQLLANNQQQKKALMQQLLTGKKRLLDKNGVRFSGEWKRVELGDLLDYQQPTPYLVESTEYSDDFSTPVLTAGKTFILGYTDEESGIFSEQLPAIIFDDFTTDSKFVDFPFKAKSSAMKILTAKEGVSIKYVYEAMQLLDFSVGGHQRHWISIYSRLVIPFPDSEEQQKIAVVLSTADQEISALQQKLDALKQEKKALMQQLLTGKRRVKIDDKEVA